MQKLRVKFLEQEYPEHLIDEQFDRVRQLNREEILYKKKDEEKKKKRAKSMRSCLVVTHNPANPPFHNWIKSLVGTLHEDPELKTLCPLIPIVTRQPPSVASMALKSMHWLGPAGPGPSQHPPGCHRLHPQRSCVCCARMEERTTLVKSTMTKREFNIRGHYNCQSTWVIYVETFYCLQAPVNWPDEADHGGQALWPQIKGAARSRWPWQAFQGCAWSWQGPVQ